MAKTVGFACSLKLQWLNKTVQLLNDNLNDVDFKKALNEYLSYEIDGETRLRKTREILMNTWYYDNPDIVPFRSRAIQLINKYPEYASAIHLCMIYLAYPVVADIGKYMGRLFEYQDEITNTVLRQKLYDEWGERGTLQTTTRRVTLTLKELGILETTSKVRYRLIKQRITNDIVISFLLRVAMVVDGKSYYSFTELNAFDVLFPFEYKAYKEELMNDTSFVVTNFGGELSVALKSE